MRDFTRIAAIFRGVLKVCKVTRLQKEVKGRQMVKNSPEWVHGLWFVESEGFALSRAIRILRVRVGDARKGRGRGKTGFCALVECNYKYTTREYHMHYIHEVIFQ